MQKSTWQCDSLGSCKPQIKFFFKFPDILQFLWEYPSITVSSRIPWHLLISLKFAKFSNISQFSDMILHWEECLTYIYGRSNMSNMKSASNLHVWGCSLNPNMTFCFSESVGTVTCPITGIRISKILVNKKLQEIIRKLFQFDQTSSKNNSISYPSWCDCGFPSKERRSVGKSSTCFSNGNLGYPNLMYITVKFWKPKKYIYYNVHLVSYKV